MTKDIHELHRMAQSAAQLNDLRTIATVNGDAWTFDENSPQWQTILGTRAMLKMRPPEPIPDGFDVETERRRTKQGGCCGKGSG